MYYKKLNLLIGILRKQFEIFNKFTSITRELHRRISLVTNHGFSAANSIFSFSSDTLNPSVISFVPLQFISFMNFIAIGCKDITPIDECFFDSINVLKYYVIEAIYTASVL